MKNIEEINRSNLNKIIAERKHPDFFPGDIVKVGVRITEGKRDRIQYFEGVCIAKKSRDINSSFTVRKISFGEGVERTFALYSPIVDTIKVVRSGKVRRAKLYYLRDRIQYFEGVCIAKKNRDINSSFTVRKISFGEGVERTFALYSPIVDTIKVVRSGKVRRAKLYYLRDRTGKSARIAEKIKKKIGIDIETKIQEVTEENVMPATEDKSSQEVKEETPKEETKAEATKEETTKVKSEPAQENVQAKEEQKKEQSKDKTEQKK